MGETAKWDDISSKTGSLLWRHTGVVLSPTVQGQHPMPLDHGFKVEGKRNRLYRIGINCTDAVEVV